MKYLLDTNICIYLIRQKPAHLRQRFASYSLPEIGISAITAAELHYGVERSSQPAKNRQALELFLLPLTILGFDYSAVEAYGRVRAGLEAVGMPIGALDTLIAAQALIERLILVTNNTREFARVPGLVIEDWTQP